MPKPIDNSIRKLIVQHRQEGKSVKRTAEMFKISTRTVLNICKCYEETGSVSAEKSTGRLRSTTAEEECLRQTSRNNPFKSARAMKTELALPVSIDTVNRRLREADLRGRRAAKKQLLTTRQMIDRIGFAYQYHQWNNSDWSTMVFSDEKIFCSDGAGDIWVHRPKGQRYASPYVYQKRRRGRFSVGLWGWRTSAGPGKLVRIEGNLTAPQYIDILENSLLPALQMLFEDEVVCFVQDKSPIHKAGITKNWLANQEKVKEIDWPATAADLNPIENLWTDLTIPTLTGSTPDELWQEICVKWKKFPANRQMSKFSGKHAEKIDSGY